MAGINGKKVLIAGAASGVAMVVVDMLTNGLLLSSYWDAAMARLSLPPFSEGGLGDLAVLLATDIVYGILIAFLYAAIRPRFGPGVRTALIASVLVWLPGLLLMVGMSSMGMFEWSFILLGGVASLVVALVGGYIAGWLYSE